MKAIGILGGMSPESTRHYYEHIIRKYFDRFNDYNYPEIIIYSVNFQKYVRWQNENNWSAAADDMIKVFGSLAKAGADFGIIATNTMHKVFDEVQKSSQIPILSIMDAAADRIVAAGKMKVGLLGTIFTMREQFYKTALERKGIDVVVPPEGDQVLINRVIFDELTRGLVTNESKAMFVQVVKGMAESGCEGVVLGCTEIPMVISEDDTEITLFNTTTIHAESALDYALKTG